MSLHNKRIPAAILLSLLLLSMMLPLFNFSLGVLADGSKGIVSLADFPSSDNLAIQSASFLINQAMIMNINDPNYGGIRGSLYPNGTWVEPMGYTETTGYEIQSLVDLYEATGDTTYLNAAITASNWEISVVQYMGNDSNGYGGIRRTDSNNPYLSAWHTAAVIAGLAEVWEVTQNQTYLNSINAGADFIIRANTNQQQIAGAGLVGNYNLPGKWFGSDYLSSSAGAQAYFMLTAYDVINNSSYLSIAEKNLNVLVSSQLQNGTWMRFIYNNGTALPMNSRLGQQVENYAHYIMYIAMGLLKGYEETGNSTYLTAGLNAWNYVLNNLYSQSTGLTTGNGRAEDAQFGIVADMLYSITGDTTYLGYANTEISALSGIQTSDGGLPNVDGVKDTWANKFAIDLCLYTAQLTPTPTPTLSPTNTVSPTPTPTSTSPSSIVTPKPSTPQINKTDWSTLSWLITTFFAIAAIATLVIVLRRRGKVALSR